MATLERENVAARDCLSKRNASPMSFKYRETQNTQGHADILCNSAWTLVGSYPDRGTP